MEIETFLKYNNLVHVGNKKYSVLFLLEIEILCFILVGNRNIQFIRVRNRNILLLIFWWQ